MSVGSERSRAKELCGPSLAIRTQGFDMSEEITALYTGILAHTIVAMGINVMVRRFRSGMMIVENVVRRVVRIRGTSVEYIPLCALLMALYELDGGKKMVLHATGVVLIVGRILSAGLLWFHDDGPSPNRMNGRSARRGPHMGYYRSSSNAKYSAVPFLARARA